MRRLSAILLLALFSLSLTSFAFQSDPEANLPACCRRHGNHHCTLSGGKTAGSGFQTNNRCPLFPSLGVVTTASVPLRLTPRVSVSAPDYARTLLPRPDVIRVRTQQTIAYGERAPPSFPKQA